MSHQSATDLATADSESEDDSVLRARLQQAYSSYRESPCAPLIPSGTVPPYLWNRISRWFRQGAPAILLQLLLCYQMATDFHLPYGDVDFIE